MSGHTKTASRCLSASAAIAVATALSVASPAFAAADQATTAPAPQPTDSRYEQPQTGTHIRKAGDPKDLEKVVTYIGADLRPGDTQWTDNDTSAPALPMTRNQDTASR